MITALGKHGPFAYKTKPFAHQEEWLEKTWNRPHFAFFWEMGCAKTKVILDSAARLFLAGEIDGLLIITDGGVYRNWTDYEAPIHMPDNVPYRLAFWTSTMGKRTRHKANQLLRAHDDVLDILAMSVESFAFEKTQDFARGFLESHYAMVVVDESTSIKSLESKRTKAVLSLRELAPYRRIMSGTPMANNVLDLYSQAEFLAPGLLGTESFVCYRAEYCKLMLTQLYAGGRSAYKIIGFQNLDKLKQLLLPWSSRLLKTDCLDLPEKVYETIHVEHTPEQAKAYRELKTLAVAQLSQGLVTALSAISLLSKLQRISCGHIALDKASEDDAVVVDIPSNRMRAMLSVLEKIEGKAIIWACYRRDIELICKALEAEYGSESYVHFYGGTSQSQRPLSVAQFKASPKCRFMVSNQSVGGKGNTWTEASYAIYYSNSMHLERRLQSEDRIHRPGQVNKCTIIDLATPHTVDMKILKNLKDKKDLASQVLDYLPELLMDQDLLEAGGE